MDELIARLEAAAGGSETLDDEISYLIKYPRFRYTRSLDAALTLVPEECAFSVGRDFTGVACVYGHDIHADECAETPELALCIAALKARRKSDENRRENGAAKSKRPTSD